MTPPHADVAFVLDGIAGVLGVYALTPSHDGLALAVELEAPRFIPAAHYALLRVLSHEECGGVTFFYPSLKLTPRLLARARELPRLSDAERDAARLRVPPPERPVFVHPAPASSPVLVKPFARGESPPPSRRLLLPEDSAPLSVLLVDLSPEIADALRRIFPDEARIVTVDDSLRGVDVAFSRPFHAILAGSRTAVWRGFLDRIRLDDFEGAERIVVLADLRDVPWVRWNLDKWKRHNAILPLPVDDVFLQREVLRHHPRLVGRMAVAEAARIASSPERELVPVRKKPFRRLRVLVVDDEIRTAILFAAGFCLPEIDVIHAATAIDAFTRVSDDTHDLVICSASMRVEGGEPFYRTLWRMRPELKGRFVLLADPDAMPASVSSSARPRAVVRPLTADAIAGVVEAFA